MAPQALRFPHAIWYAYTPPFCFRTPSEKPYWIAVCPPNTSLPSDMVFYAHEREDVAAWVEKKIHPASATNTQGELNLE